MHNQDIIYVIYLDGKLYKDNGRKCTYLKIGSAKQVITVDSKNLAETMCLNNNKYWWELRRTEQQKLIDKARKRFEIREFMEKKQTDNDLKEFIGMYENPQTEVLYYKIKAKDYKGAKDKLVNKLSKNDEINIIYEEYLNIIPLFDIEIIE